MEVREELSSMENVDGFMLIEVFVNLVKRRNKRKGGESVLYIVIGRRRISHTIWTEILHWF